jgi:hypothetical protein
MESLPEFRDKILDAEDGNVVVGEDVYNTGNQTLVFSTPIFWCSEDRHLL